MILRIARSHPNIKLPPSYSGKLRLQDSDQTWQSLRKLRKFDHYISQTAISHRIQERQLHSWAYAVRSISPSNSKIKPQHTRFLGVKRAVELGFLGAPSTLVPKSSKSNIQTIEIEVVLFLEHLQEFHLDLGIPCYSNILQVSCLGMNSGRGWNHNLEGSYLPEYSESEVEFGIQCTSRFYLWPLQLLAPEPSPISGYSKCTRTQQFQYLGFFQLGFKLGFDFPGVSPNQNIDPSL